MTTSNHAHPSLAVLREQIDQVDAALVKLFAERFAITEQVGVFKRDHHMPPADPAREQAQAVRIRQLAKDNQVDPELTWKIFRIIIDAVVANHKKLRMNDPSSSR